MSQIKTNTAALQDILDAASNLPKPLDTSDATATSSKIFNGYTAYVNDKMIAGTFSLDTELSTQDDLIAQIQTALQNKASASEPVLQTKTVTPTTSVQNVTPDSGYDGLSKVTVNAIPSTYVKPTTTKAATTYTPTTSNQTIAAGTYCSGAQTIKGDANLKAENIAEGVSIFGVTGTHSGGGSGGGASVEMCTGEIIVDAPNMTDFTVYAVNENLQTVVLTVDCMMGGSFNAAKGTIVAVAPWSSVGYESGCVRIFGSMTGAAFEISDDFKITYQ